MAAAFDLVIYRARLRGDPSVLVDIGVADGRVTAVGQVSDARAPVSTLAGTWSPPHS